MSIKGAIFNVLDNTGVYKVKCLDISENISIGDTVTVSVKERSPTSKIKKGVCSAVIVTMRKPTVREDGSMIKFDQNTVVLVTKDGQPIGSRILGAIAREAASVNSKIASLAQEVV